MAQQAVARLRPIPDTGGLGWQGGLGGGVSDGVAMVIHMSQLEPTLPDGYAEALASLKSQVTAAQHHAQRLVNTAMIELYWGIGRTILKRQEDAPWGSRVLDRLAADLRAEFPHMKGFSRFRTNEVVERPCPSGPAVS